MGNNARLRTHGNGAIHHVATDLHFALTKEGGVCPVERTPVNPGFLVERPELTAIQGEQQRVGFGSQIRSYVLAPYRMIKDHRTKLSIGDVDRVLDGDTDRLTHAFLVYKHTGKTAGDGKEDLPE